MVLESNIQWWEKSRHGLPSCRAQFWCVPPACAAGVRSWRLSRWWCCRRSRPAGSSWLPPAMRPDSSRPAARGTQTHPSACLSKPTNDDKIKMKSSGERRPPPVYRAEYISSCILNQFSSQVFFPKCLQTFNLSQQVTWPQWCAHTAAHCVIHLQRQRVVS